MAYRSRGSQQQRLAAAGGREEGAARHDPHLAALDTYFGGQRFKDTLLAILGPDLEKIKQEQVALKSLMDALTSELQHVRERAREDDGEDGGPSSATVAFAGASRNHIYKMLERDSFFPIINQIMMDLLQSKEFQVVNEEDKLAHGEEFLVWQKRKAKASKVLHGKVLLTVNKPHIHLQT
jgi:hypothetical protein